MENEQADAGRAGRTSLARPFSQARTDTGEKSFNFSCFLRPFLRPFLTRKFFQEILGLEGSKNFLGKFRQVHNLHISDRLFYDPRVFFKKIFLVLYAAYFVVREEGMGWGGKTLMEE